MIKSLSIYFTRTLKLGNRVRINNLSSPLFKSSQYIKHFSDEKSGSSGEKKSKIENKKSKYNILNFFLQKDKKIINEEGESNKNVNNAKNEVRVNLVQNKTEETIIVKKPIKMQKFNLIPIQEKEFQTDKNQEKEKIGANQTKTKEEEIKIMKATIIGKKETDSSDFVQPIAKKPIMLRKIARDEEDHLWEEREELTKLSTKMPKESHRKWERFFKRNTKTLLDLNRAVNNKPDKTYLEFFHDMKDNLNEEQFLFAVKNLIMNKDKDIVLTYHEIMVPLYYNIIKQRKISLSSKSNILTLVEIFYYINFLPTLRTSKFYTPILEYALDYIRLFAKSFTIEEYLLVLDVLLNGHNIYDAFLVESLFSRFSSKEFEQIMSNEKVYRVKYFGNEINLARSVLLAVENYINFQKATNGVLKRATLIENILESFIKNLTTDKLTIKQLDGLIFNFNTIASVFPFEISLHWERALNSIILQRLNYEWNKFFPHDIDSIKLEDLNLHLTLLNWIKNNNLYSRDLLEDLFHKICHVFVRKLNQMEYHNFLFYTSDKKWIYDYIELKDTFMSMVNSLMEIAIEHKLYNKELIEPFLIFLCFELTTKNSNKSDIMRSNLLSIFGRYNLEAILKQDQFSQISLDCYFKILFAIENFTLDSMQYIINNIKEIKGSGINFESKISTNDNIFPTLKEFYTQICDIEENESDVLNLYNEKEKTLANNSNYFLSRFKVIPKNLQQITYISSDYILKPLDTITSSKSAFNVLLQFETVLDYMIVLINSNIVRVTNCDYFLRFLNELVTEDSTAKIDNSASLYDSVIKEALLMNKNLNKKLTTILNFIFFPKNYYKLYENSEEITLNKANNNNLTHEELKNMITEKYNLEGYSTRSLEEEKKLNFYANNFSDKTLFKASLKGLINNSDRSELEEFVDNFYQPEENLITKMLDDNRYEISHQHFINQVLAEDKGALYYAPEQINLYNFPLDEIKEVGNNTISKEHLNLYKILIDLSKISQVIDRNLLAIESVTDIVAKIDSFYLKTGENKNSTTDQNINNSLNNFTTLNFYLGNIKNISDISTAEVLKSHLSYQYLKWYLYEVIIKENKKFDLKKYKLDKNLEHYTKYYAVFPYLALYAFSEHSDKVNWLILLSDKYKNTAIVDKEFEMSVSYLKSQFDNILII